MFFTNHLLINSCLKRLRFIQLSALILIFVVISGCTSTSQRIYPQIDKKELARSAPSVKKSIYIDITRDYRPNKNEDPNENFDYFLKEHIKDDLISVNWFSEIIILEPKSFRRDSYENTPTNLDKYLIEKKRPSTDYLLEVHARKLDVTSAYWSNAFCAITLMIYPCKEQHLDKVGIRIVNLSNKTSMEVIYDESYMLRSSWLPIVLNSNREPINYGEREPISNLVLLALQDFKVRGFFK